jgi:hypothetical protein
VFCPSVFCPCVLQGAIDAANQEYQKRKTVYSARINVMVDYLNQVRAVMQRVGDVKGAQRVM